MICAVVNWIADEFLNEALQEFVGNPPENAGKCRLIREFHGCMLHRQFCTGMFDTQGAVLFSVATE